MKLMDKISRDLKDAMKKKEKARISALRMIRTEVVKKQKESKNKELSDEQIISVLQSLAHSYQDSIEQFRKGGRDELAEEEEAQLEIVKSYLPEKISTQEIRDTVDKVIEETGTMSKKDFGKVMGTVMRQLKETDKLVEGAEVKEVVNAALEELEKD